MGETTGAELHHAEDATEPLPPTVEATATKMLSYALAHNRVPLVSRVLITNPGRPIAGATLRLSVRDAQGPIGSPVELLVDLAAGGSTVLTDVPLRVDPSAMLQVEEQRPGTIAVEVAEGDQLLAQCAVPVQVLAAQQWLATPLSLAMEMLAAHVIPNHPSITALVSDAADLLNST